MPRKRQQDPVRSNPLSSQIEVWYEKLEEEGFNDIEELSNSEYVLKDYHCRRFQSEETLAKIAKRSRYYEAVSIFTNSPDFPEIVRLMVRHRNNLYSALQVEKIWDMHREGATERGIASEMGCSQSCIHFMLKRMREWMSLIA